MHKEASSVLSHGLCDVNTSASWYAWWWYLTVSWCTAHQPHFPVPGHTGSYRYTSTCWGSGILQEQHRAGHSQLLTYTQSQVKVNDNYLNVKILQIESWNYLTILIMIYAAKVTFYNNSTVMDIASYSHTPSQMKDGQILQIET